MRKRDRNFYIRHIVLIVLFAFATVITIKNNLHIDNGDELLGLQFFSVYLFKFSPLLIFAGLEGVTPAVFSCFILFGVKTVVNKELAFITGIYLVGAATTHYFSMSGMFAKKRKALLAMLFYMLFYGSIWGGCLGILAGRRFIEFMPTRNIWFFLNEFPEAFITVAILYLILGKGSNKLKALFFSGVYYRSDVDELSRKMADIRKSKLSISVSMIISIQAVALGIAAVIYANTLIPNMKQSFESGIIKQVDQITQSTDWSKMTNIIHLEQVVSQIESVKQTGYLRLTLNNDTLIFDTKLILLILIVIIPMAVIANQYAQFRITRPIMRLADSVQSFYDLGAKGLDENLRRLQNLNIRTDDEIEYMYSNFNKTAETMVSYIKMIQAQRSLADELRAQQMANEAKNNFLSSMSHEIRTPINAMLGFNEMILRESKDAEILKYASNVNSSGKLLLGLVNDILDFSRIEAGKTEIIPVEYDLSSLINDLVNTAHMRVQGKNLELKTNIATDIPCILFGDEIRIKQCAMNVITNAVKYTNEGSVTISVDYTKIDDENISLRFSVKDTGIGIRKEDMDKLFAPFERIEESRNRTIEGTGLGMNIVKQLLSLMNSRLLVSSEYGKGSEFSFSIKQKVLNWNPIGDFEATYEETLLGQDTYHESFHAPEAKILVVDDTLANLTVIQGLLKQTQVQVDVAESGFEALEKVCENKYNIIFMDHRMPKMDGVETYRAMKELDENLNKDVPVFALTANVISGAREMYMKEGFAGYIPKPVDSARLEDAILKTLPEELIIRPDDEEFNSVIEAEEIGAEDLEAIGVMTNIKGIDYETGVKNCGGPSALKKVATNFALAIENNSKSIEDAWHFDDLENYTTYVHGLKSSARVIGAIELSNLAAYLEQCGNKKDKDEIERRTPELLANYREYIDFLKPLIDEATAETEEDLNKPLIEPEELKGALRSLKEFVEGSYFDSADDVVSMMDDYRMPDDFKGTYKEIKRLLAAVDRDGLLKIL
ncbi:ATP-binding protein [Butyrivibrio sp. INlla16]|uniref:ATP-binding protein n=1 Tax=Butyrivibrio sp. INlla16 TaxID=1520807 RepID=UPI000886C939|nr:ATP-binding protein [Butyrivibrio sp. INlla16]SDB40629.1 Signal transduction histidine kinase [Butyrivibrio sp. INlla16]